uniref:Uncharacterized protein n=1 Tax=Chlamydomonas chlamydogama TaxID=225041 RepID=A0A7S2VV94_9CHLO|mmetsp:Transcript_182/g.323  ORF Transcript_182/g.323 Transcript_182/m.323 type:complete len:156 (+) Transcript_182:91-558(+)|eukprot:CAMPEP_0202903598 /NCGR_PEP_ID=MMETSP1392-20130828/25305_1 /ASSEMBLY_ACC=CAM_ASM_000868 /TAXON_ID=225041 /ORGANISM="Chlamydomonas chlamydogama, Strain SAG 11-48b" /LENGTH=155 /DNA_ID=CAMNT_0049590853 /DNA_START=34 /DNA_END=501 /DNA_ORIENTATION=-
MKAAVVQAPTGKSVLLFPDEDLGSTVDLSKTQGARKSDAGVVAGIQRYLEKQESSRKMRHQELLTGPADPEEHEEHTGLTDDELNSDGEVDYDYVSRSSLKASSEALVDIVNEVKALKMQEAIEEKAAKPTGSSASKSKAPVPGKPLAGPSHAAK